MRDICDRRVTEHVMYQFSGYRVWQTGFSGTGFRFPVVLGTGFQKPVFSGVAGYRVAKTGYFRYRVSITHSVIALGSKNRTETRYHLRSSAPPIRIESVTTDNFNR